jgi:hypothetical protein
MFVPIVVIVDPVGADITMFIARNLFFAVTNPAVCNSIQKVGTRSGDLRFEQDLVLRVLRVEISRPREAIFICLDLPCYDNGVSLAEL